MKWVLVLIAIFVGACTQAPTKVYESQRLDYKELYSSLNQPIVVDEKIKILDVRSALDYGLSHIPDSHNFEWRSLSRMGSHPSLLEDDFKLTLRLAAVGINADDSVLIVGNPSSPDAGRLAWILLYMGITDVQTSAIDSLNVNRTNLASRPNPVSGWDPKIINSLKADKNKVLQIIAQGSSAKVHLIDVRTEKEYLKKKKVISNYALPEPPTINIEWSEFYTSDGRPNKSIVSKLKSVGIERDHQIVLISDKGIRSAAATYAITMLGFGKASNFNGGWVQITSSK